LRKRVIPKEIFEGYRLPTPAIAYAGRTHFARGGEAVMERADKTGKKSSYPVATPPQPISIINVIDPNEMDRYLSSSSGQNAVLNVLSSRGETVKRILK